MKTLVIIPAYNEEGSIKNTIKEITKLKNKNIDYIVINDGSSDNTLEVLQENNFNYLDLPSNLGIGGSVQTGYKYAYLNDYDIAIQFDGDGQHNASYIESLIKELNEGNDMVIGSRFVEDLSKFKSTKIRRMGIKVITFFIKLCTGNIISDPTSGFRAVNKEVIKEFVNDYPIDYPEPDTIVRLIKKGYKIKEIPVEMNERESGKSSITFYKSIYYMVKVVLSIIIASLDPDGGIK